MVPQVEGGETLRQQTEHQQRAEQGLHRGVGEPQPAGSLPTHLDGINIWTESRLFEENVDNVQALATARIERLVLRTHFSTARLVDWIVDRQEADAFFERMIARIVFEDDDFVPPALRQFVERIVKREHPI